MREGISHPLPSPLSRLSPCWLIGSCPGPGNHAPPSEDVPVGLGRPGPSTLYYLQALVFSNPTQKTGNFMQLKWFSCARHSWPPDTLLRMPAHAMA
jgi:hypothetical protein